MKIVTTGTFRYMGKTYPRDTVLDLPDVVAAEAIDDGVADPAEETAPSVGGESVSAEPAPDPTPQDAAVPESSESAVGGESVPAESDTSAKKGRRG
ncbi:hypothetical protein G3N56_07885 [Desulfovibrio sulfodismutans]|uniref:Uncharacterized protein n=1 Tax=Desulfolutivibrio sulfodismutans TaxID=63561 RepID=A0A7K3NKG0_9BACT|nr:hypothetical protein [Desulfolutivibrio sulfodismutans]NDY56662.1 hypothetical protein [Desulfolutivibrio sulfodismutans]QLA11238.1 hypothetical protein GD606_02575 [Desulfolutivibrio sulfodismutans DSM 3696]